MLIKAILKAGECEACHGEKMKESFVQTGTEVLHKQLAALIAKRILASKEKIACVTSWDEKTDKDTPNTPIDGKQIKAVEIPMGIHGQISLKFVMQDGKAVLARWEMLRMPAESRQACLRNVRSGRPRPP
jgi:hypothetical protein